MTPTGLTKDRISSTPAHMMTPAAAVTVERRLSRRWSRVKVAVAALLFCSLVALFIQQTRYVRRWKQLMTPLDVAQHFVTTLPGIGKRLEDASPVPVITTSSAPEVTPEEIFYSGPSSFKEIQLFSPESSDKITEPVLRRDDSSKHKGEQISLVLDYRTDDGEENDKNFETETNVNDDDDKDGHPVKTTEEAMPKSNHESEQEIPDIPEETAGAAEKGVHNAKQPHEAQAQDLDSSFNSQLVVTERDWPLVKHLTPIRLKTALGMKSSSETSATRPIKVAFIRHCMHDDPKCHVHDTMKLAKFCPYPGLVQTENWAKADIVVISVWRMRNARYVPDFRRPPGQIWVMLSVEAPSRKTNHTQLDYPGLKGQFNLTMSYRLDADIPYPYGYLQRGHAPRDKDFEAVYSGKRFHAAWLVSHCNTNSRREKYVRMLRFYGLQVHIYGLCGGHSCHGGKSSKDEGDRAPDSVCMPHISKSYYFYLSFENTMCKDYITEKLFKVYDPVDLIPVVMGGADYARVLPPGTFVDTGDFPTAKDLAKYLVRLANNRRRYLSMLREKHRWHRVPRPRWYCAMGEKLATGLRPRVLPDTRTWYTKDQCWRPDE